jgi:hypothetical protein
MSFLHDYDLFASNNEAPRDYHRWASLFVLSSIVSRKVWIDQGIFTIYPNLYLVFVGPPGNGKSTAMMIGQKMVRAFPDIPIAAAAITKEMITKTMGGEGSELKRAFTYDSKQIEFTPMTFFANELTTLFGASPIPMVGFFTDIYDREVFDVSTKRSGCDLIQGPYINLLGCMTPDVTSSMLKQSIISAGFNRRCIFVNALKRGDPVPFPMVTPEMDAAWKRCVAWGKQIQAISGPFLWEDSARSFFAAWYNEKHKALQTHTDIVTQGYFVTKDVMLLKISMLIALSASKELLLKTEHLQKGLEMLEYTEHNLSRVFSGTGRNVLVPMKEKLIQMLEIAHPAPLLRRKVEAELYTMGSQTEINETLKHCVDQGLIRGVPGENGVQFIELINPPKQ